MLSISALILSFLISGSFAIGEVTLHHTYSGGWSLVSVPLFPADSSPGKVYQDVARPLRAHAYKDWHYTGGGDSDLTEIRPGMGHWLYLEGKTTIQVTGGLVNPAAESTILIKPGWNLVGNPWAVPHEWKDTEVSIFDGTSTLPLSQAVTAGWIEGDLHDYQSSTNAYNQIEPNNIINQQMEPWKGYLLYSNIEALLKLAPFPEDSSLLFGNLISPVEGAVITEPTTVIGSAVAVDLMQYTLEYALAGTDDFTTFMIGTENVDAATLGTFDPTVLINGAYTIRLSAVDIRGVNDSVSIRCFGEG